MENIEQTLLTIKDLVTRWGISTATVDRRVREGLISPVEGHKTPQFNLYDILEIEGTDTSKLSLFERRRLERTIERLEEEVHQLREDKEKLKSILINQSTELMTVLREV